jgi:DNA modification methylase
MTTTSGTPQIQKWTLDRLIPYACNPRKNDGAVERMMASTEEFGFKIPILARSDGQVVDGHLRLKAAQRLGLPEVPVILCDEWTPAQVKAFRLLANRSVTWAAWDDELLALELTELKTMDFKLDLTGFEPHEIASCLAKQDWKNAALTDADDAPPQPAYPVSRIGDVWVMGRHRLLCGDATLKESVERLMQGELADAAFSDPPYNINYDGAGSAGESWLRATKGRRVKKQVRTMLNDNLSDEQFLEFCRALFTNLRRAVKNTAPVYVCCSDRAMPQFRQAFAEAGFHWSCTVIWAKHQFTLSRADLHPQHEPILYGWPRGEKHYWCGRRDLGTVWSLAKPRVNELHPTQKPIELIERVLENSSRPGDLIVDLCGGSGSTLIACEKTARQARLMELDPKYADVIVSRWQSFTGNVAVLDGDGRSFAAVQAERDRKAA